MGTLKHVGNFVGGFWEGPGEQTYGKEVLKGEWKKGKFVKPPEEKKDAKKK